MLGFCTHFSLLERELQQRRCPCPVCELLVLVGSGLCVGSQGQGHRTCVGLWCRTGCGSPRGATAKPKCCAVLGTRRVWRRMRGSAALSNWSAGLRCGVGVPGSFDHPVRLLPGKCFGFGLLDSFANRRYFVSYFLGTSLCCLVVHRMAMLLVLHLVRRSAARCVLLSSLSLSLSSFVVFSLHFALFVLPSPLPTFPCPRWHKRRFNEHGPAQCLIDALCTELSFRGPPEHAGGAARVGRGRADSALLRKARQRPMPNLGLPPVACAGVRWVGERQGTRRARQSKDVRNAWGLVSALRAAFPVLPASTLIHFWARWDNVELPLRTEELVFFRSTSRRTTHVSC